MEARMKYFIALTGLLALLLSSCSAQTPPTVDPAQIQASALAGANTIVAMTQAALPTVIPSPIPTDTPLPSPTSMLEAPTAIPVAPAATASPQSGEDNCVHALNVAGAGPTHRTLIKNQTSATVSLSLNLYKPNSFGECGAISYANLHKGDQLMAELPSGYWYAYMWASAGKKNFTQSISFFVQPAQFDKLELCLRTDNIKYAPSC